MGGNSSCVDHTDTEIDVTSEDTHEVNDEKQSGERLMINRHGLSSFKTLALATLLSAVGLNPALSQTFPEPTDEAKLYEAAKKEGSVVWYGGAPLEPMRAMADDFMAKYPGVKVEILRLVGVAQYQRFMQETEAKQHIADVLHVGDRPSMDDLVSREHVVSWKVPTYDRIPEDARIGTHSYTAYINDSTIGYNSKNLKPDEIKLLDDWKGLLDPRFKGRIAISNQYSGSHMGTIQMFLSPKYKDQFGLPFLTALAGQKLKIYNDVTIPVDRVVAGEQDIVIFPTEGSLSAPYLKGAPIRWTHPKPTSAFGNTWFAVSKYAPHPNGARLFLNWVMGDDGAKSVLTKYNGIPVLMGVKDERAVSKEPWYQPITQGVAPDWAAWARGDVERDFAIWDKLMKDAQ